MDLEDGILAVKAARQAVEAETKGAAADISFPQSFDEESGVFVTIDTYPEKELRGCIGYPEAAFPLKDALVFSAQSACHDPRFPPLSSKEAEECVIEVTVLSKPVLMECEKKDLADNIVIGRDGLIIQFGRKRGVLLPQVPVEWDWTPEEFLCQLSLKACLPPDAWTYKGTDIWRFSGEIFHETSPKGEIVRG